MKKQILTLTMCLALTTTAALANGINAVTQKAAQQAKVTTSAVENQVKPAPPAMTGKPEEQKKFMTKEEAKKHFEEKAAKRRELMFKDLGFSAEQKTKFEALDLKTREEGRKLFKNVEAETMKLRDLKSKKASKFAIWKQEMALNSAKKAARKHFESSKKAFDAILTKEQKVKMEKFRKSHKGPRHKGMGPKGHKGPHGPEHMGPPPEGMGQGPHGPKGPEPMGPPPEKK